MMYNVVTVVWTFLLCEANFLILTETAKISLLRLNSNYFPVISAKFALTVQIKFIDDVSGKSLTS